MVLLYHSSGNGESVTGGRAYHVFIRYVISAGHCNGRLCCSSDGRCIWTAETIPGGVVADEFSLLPRGVAGFVVGDCVPFVYKTGGLAWHCSKVLHVELGCWS